MIELRPLSSAFQPASLTNFRREGVVMNGVRVKLLRQFYSDPIHYPEGAQPRLRERIGVRSRKLVSDAG